jgi:hypothetical protein
MEQLIQRQRVKVAQWEEYPRIGLFLDELPNTPLPNIQQWFAESRGLGVSICAAAQATSQLDVIYGPLQGKAIREVVPATLIMYGAHEEELMRSAAFWGGKTTRSHQSYDHNRDDSSTSRQFGNVFEPEELSPRDIGEARLLVRGKPGETVELIEWADFVKYLATSCATPAAEEIRVRLAGLFEVGDQVIQIRWIAAVIHDPRARRSASSVIAPGPMMTPGPSFVTTWRYRSNLVSQGWQGAPVPGVGSASRRGRTFVDCHRESPRLWYLFKSPGQRIVREAGPRGRPLRFGPPKAGGWLPRGWGAATEANAVRDSGAAANRR